MSELGVCAFLLKLDKLEPINAPLSLFSEPVSEKKAPKLRAQGRSQANSGNEKRQSASRLEASVRSD